MQSKVYIRHALAVFAYEENLPCVVHCTHGEAAMLKLRLAHSALNTHRAAAPHETLAAIRGAHATQRMAARESRFCI